MRALTWHGIEDVRITEVPDPVIQEPTDAVVRVTSTAICGSDLHLYKVLAPYLTEGDVLGHEFMGVVEEVGSAVENLAVGDRVVVPFNISCGHCWMCERGLFAQCETTQNVEQGKGASLFGYTSLYGAVPGGQAERVRVPHADFGPVKVPEGMSDERYLYVSDILPTAWQGLKFADVPEGGSLAVLGLGPVGQLAVRAAKLLGIEEVYAVDLVPERLELAREWGAHVVDLSTTKDVPEALRELTDGRGPDSVLEAVGMEAHGNPVSEKVIGLASRMPGPVARAAIESFGIDRVSALHTAFAAVRRGGTVSISGVYGGMADPMPMMDMFDKGLTLRMGQCHVRRWTDEITAVLDQSEDVLGVEGLATHHVPLEQAPEMYRTFQRKEDGCLKVVLTP
ncbi:zinc-dependent alcohol dehydrogenase [Terracoccus luteus]|uniref:Threonine dehydrogenase-like Zn-dependent dehydrogenase n=1 Tax=Terracoccus luteus TaxID=53356 RepID=A0A839PTF9_9MICO|nr:zinc-dependent alcohol dehydrogenase [Terracoccus luteus]MBB2986044.1 threonine dehydrogenase-like Zn-dependent dehydrogenase [Terracoccus luteus]MCP2171696.1 threonine dehydrogenase-like Zn-dependent dehydrogenase [Terracoccus luteus]